jgi:hypothetical protein
MVRQSQSRPGPRWMTRLTVLIWIWHSRGDGPSAAMIGARGWSCWMIRCAVPRTVPGGWQAAFYGP